MVKSSEAWKEQSDIRALADHCPKSSENMLHIFAFYTFVINNEIRSKCYTGFFIA